MLRRLFQAQALTVQPGPVHFSHIRQPEFFQGISRYLNLTNGEGQGHQSAAIKLTPIVYVWPRCIPGKNSKHTNHAEQQTDNAIQLHVFDQPDAVPEVLDLTEGLRLRVLHVPTMKLSDQVGDGQKRLV